MANLSIYSRDVTS